MRKYIVHYGYGNKAYSKLIEIIYAVGDLTNRDMNDIVEELDNITAQRF